MTLKKEDIWLLDCVYDEGLIDKCERGKSNETCGCCPNCMVVSVSRLREVLKELMDTGFMAQFSEDKDCGTEYAKDYDVVEIKDIENAFAVVLEEK